MSTFSPSRVLVLGCGGIGGIIAGHLLHRQATRADVVVHVVARNPELRRTLLDQGFVVRGLGNESTFRGEVLGSIPSSQVYDFVLLAMQPPDVEAAARQASAHLAPDGRIVCLQNGLCEDRVASTLGTPDRVLGGVVSFGGSSSAPGVYERTSAGGFVLGRPDGGLEPQLERLASLLDCVGPVMITENLNGVRWSKLAINSAISTLGTLAGVRLGALVSDRRARRFALEIFTECVVVARASNVRLEKVSGTLDVDWISLRRGDGRRVSPASRLAKEAIIAAVGLKYRRMRSSMLAALERGQVPPVDFLNGEIVTRALALGLSAPANEAAVDFVWRLYRHEAKPGFTTLHAAYDSFEATRTA
ncbi:MAG: ketopantoate reductase family protein [Myxococcales bacterium]|nr:ketopantoate reductase family protein [Myxococcales bacterium]